MATAFQPNAFQNDAFQIDVATADSRHAPAGAAKKQYRKRAVVEIDGEQFTVRNEAEAEALLDQVQALAREQAPAIAKSALNKARKVKRKTGAMPTLEVAIPEIRVVSGDSDMRELIAATQQAMDEIYLRAAQAAEIAWHIRRKQMEDDEEDVALLLLNL